MDKSDLAPRRDWNQEVFDLYARLREEGDQKWQEALEKRLENTEPSLPPEVYVGSYRSATVGDLQIGWTEGEWTLETGLIDFEMTHWHLDTFLAEYKPWEMREFTTFNIGTDGTIVSLEFLGHTFERVDEE
jgi:hypothetical protein